MGRKLIGLAVGCALAVAVYAGEASPVSIAAFVKALAAKDKFEVIGLDAVGDDTFTPFDKPVPADRSLARALAHYNYIINYGDGRITRVTVLGAKSETDGAVPDDVSPAPAEPPEPVEPPPDEQPAPDGGQP